MKRLAVLLSLSACVASAGMPVRASDSDLAAYHVDLQPGCAVGKFSATGRPQFEVAGYADLEARRRITSRTQFLIASASKQFTALAVMLLIDQGRIGLDDPARRWLPEMSGAVGEATVRQLLHQTAGVRDHTTLMTLVGVEQLGSLDRARTLALMARQQGTNFPPGSRSQYSNGNYLLLSEIVVRASGMTFERYLEKAIFRPLGMRDSLALPAGSRDLKRLAHGYGPTGEGYAVADDVPATSGSGGVVTTVADLARFDRDFYREARVWRPEIKAMMLEPGRLADGSVAVLPEFGSPYGAGLGLDRRDGELWVEHNGGAEGFAADYVRRTGARRSVAVLCNRADARPTRLAESLLGAAPPRAAPARPPGPQAAPEPFTDLALIAGRYRSEDLDAVYDFRPVAGGFEVIITSPWTPAPVVDGWGGLRRYGADEFGTGPIRVVYALRDGRAETLTLRFGRRVEGLKLVRIP